VLFSMMCIWGLICVASIGEITSDDAASQTKDI